MQAPPPQPSATATGNRTPWTSAMTSTITLSPTRSTTTNAPSNQTPNEIWGRLAKTVSSTAKRATASTGTPVSRQSAEQVKASATAFVNKCWKDYAKKYPEAFLTRGSLATSATPKLVFVQTQAEFDKNFGSSSGTSDMIAFVKSDDPTRVYVHTDNLVKYANKFGPNYVKAALSHELIHSLTHPVIERLDHDAMGKTTSGSGVQKALKSEFYFDATNSPGIKSIVSVQELIQEFAAEHYATKSTGLQSFSVAYAPLRATGEKLLHLVGESTFRKAVLANDPAAYRQVVKAAEVLQVQNARAKVVNERTRDIASMRAAQAVAPFGTPLTPASLEKLERRYLRESSLYSTLMNDFPDQVKDFDFRFMKAVDANFTSRGAAYNPDLGDASSRELFAAIKAVWPSLK